MLTYCLKYKKKKKKKKKKEEAKRLLSSLDLKTQDSIIRWNFFLNASLLNSCHQ